jgi:hypothetical protein
LYIPVLLPALHVKDKPGQPGEIKGSVVTGRDEILELCRTGPEATGGQLKRNFFMISCMAQPFISPETMPHRDYQPGNVS